MVCAQFLKTPLGRKIANDGIRRSIENAVAITSANQIQPLRRYFAKILFRSCTTLTASTIKNKTSDSYTETQIANAHAIPLIVPHRGAVLDRALHSVQIAIVSRSINTD